MIDIALIGAGNVAWHLGHALESAGFSVREVYSRSFQRAADLAETFYAARPTDELDFRDSVAEVFFLVVTDHALPEVCQQIQLPEDALVVHTSGALPLSILSDILHDQRGLDVEIGVFYPCMTFTRGKSLDFKKVPVLIEAESEEELAFLKKIGDQLGKEAREVLSEDRKTLHVAAVFACNFTNHLWAVSQSLVESENLSFDLLKPLIAETTRKALAAAHPAEVQTGPAVRGDESTLQAHRQLLQDDPDFLALYITLTESIQAWHEG